MSKLFESAAGYVIFPNVGKGAVGVGGASGNGIVYQGGKIIGKSKMSQVTVGFQVGGQAYRELIFFENHETLDKFIKNKFEFSAQASAVAVKTGVSANAQYKDGTMIYTDQKGGLMYEASIGGQKFKYTAF
jgi:lipid-binding SYLF domain-containing protein